MRNRVIWLCAERPGFISNDATAAATGLHGLVVEVEIATYAQ